MLHLVGSSILFYVIDDARTNKNQVFNKMFIYHLKMAQLLLYNSYPYITYNPWHFTWNHISSTDTVALYSMNKPAPEQEHGYSNIKHGLVWNLGFPQLGTFRFSSFGVQYCALCHNGFLIWRWRKEVPPKYKIHLSDYMPSYPEKSQNKNAIILSKTIHFSLKCWVQNNKLWEEFEVFI